MRGKIGLIAKWLGRLAALLLFLFWGAFFVAHLSEWFLQADGNFPPPRVWVSQALHFVILVGLALALRWDRAGTVVAVLGTAGFIAIIGDVDVLWIGLMNLAPVVCFAVYWTSRGPVRAAP